ncbi:MAG: hypothetical protein ABL983_20525, partial [Nitrospira sp.]
ERMPAKAKPLVEKWQAWVGLAVAILTAVGLLLGLPAKWGGSPPPAALLEQELAGTVLDRVTQEPLPGVVVSLPDFDMKKTTEPNGFFSFRVFRQKQARIKFTAQKDTGIRATRTTPTWVTRISVSQWRRKNNAHRDLPWGALLGARNFSGACLRRKLVTGADPGKLRRYEKAGSWRGDLDRECR